MSTLKNTIKKAEKLSGVTVQIARANEHFVTYKGYKISFYPNGRMADDVEATNFYTVKNPKHDDITTDYFSGTFHENISQCFKMIDYSTAN